MITAEFITFSGKIHGFRVKGHSGYAGAGSDIVCAAVSAMTQLVVNAVSERFRTPSNVSVDGKTAEISFDFDPNDEKAAALVLAFKDELIALTRDYPENVRVVAN